MASAVLYDLPCLALPGRNKSDTLVVPVLKCGLPSDPVLSGGAHLAATVPRESHVPNEWRRADETVDAIVGFMVPTM